MGKNAVKFTCALWICAAIFIAARYICAAAMLAGMNPDQATFNMALESTGPVLPILSNICLVGGIVIAVMEVILAVRRNKNK